MYENRRAISAERMSPGDEQTAREEKESKVIKESFFFINRIKIEGGRRRNTLYSETPNI